MRRGHPESTHFGGLAAWPLIVCLALASGSCGRSYKTRAACELFAETAPVQRPAEADVSETKAYRSYAAVTRVEPFGERFTVWYHDGEPIMESMRIERDPEGRLRLIPEGGWWGSFAIPAASPPPIPQEKRALAREVLATLRARCGGVKSWMISYDGAHRVVSVYEFIPHQLRRPDGKPRIGWHVSAKLLMDEALTRVTELREEHSGFGVLSLPADAQLLTSPPRPGFRLSFANQGSMGFSEAIAEAARRYLARAQGPSLAALSGGDDALVPAGYASRVQVQLNVYGNTRDGKRSDRSVLLGELDLREAVFGKGATATASVNVGSSRYTLQATLIPDAPRAPQPGIATDTYRGTLSLKLADNHGHGFSRAYPVSGLLELEGETVVAPYGLSLPGASSGSAEYEARHVKLPAAAPLATIDVYVDVQLSFDARLGSEHDS